MPVISNRIPLRVMLLSRTFSWNNSSLNKQHPIECFTRHFLCSGKFRIWLKTFHDIWSRKSLKRYRQVSKCLPCKIARVSQCLSVNYFSIIRIKISDPRPLGSWCIKGADEWFYSGYGFITSFDAHNMWYESSWITDPDLGHSNGTHHNFNHNNVPLYV